MELFTPEKSELAAILQGDPNPIHYRENNIGVQIAPGLEQAGRIIKETGWLPGKQLIIEFHKPLKVPNDAKFRIRDGIEISDRNTVYSYTEILRGQPEATEFKDEWEYTLGGSELPQDFLAYKNVPAEMVAKTYGSDDLAGIIAAVGLTANAIARSLNRHRDWLPELYFPPVRSEGTSAVLEKRITLTMTGTDIMDVFRVRVAEPIEPEGSRRVNVLRTEVEGLYQIDMHVVQIPHKLLGRILDYKEDARRVA